MMHGAYNIKSEVYFLKRMFVYFHKHTCLYHHYTSVHETRGFQWRPVFIPPEPPLLNYVKMQIFGAKQKKKPELPRD